MKHIRPHPHLGGGGSRNFAELRTHVDGGERGVIFSGILCERHKCMLPYHEILCLATVELLAFLASIVPTESLVLISHPE